MLKKIFCGATLFGLIIDCLIISSSFFFLIGFIGSCTDDHDKNLVFLENDPFFWHAAACGGGALLLQLKRLADCGGVAESPFTLCFCRIQVSCQFEEFENHANDVAWPSICISCPNVFMHDDRNVCFLDGCLAS